MWVENNFSVEKYHVKKINIDLACDISQHKFLNIDMSLLHSGSGSELPTRNSEEPIK